MDTVLWILAGVLVLAGFIGILLPALPGTPLILAGLFVAAWLDGFQKVGWPTLALLAVLTALSLAVDIYSTSFGAGRTGASRAAALGAALGAVVGLFFGIPGLLLGPFIGAALGEYKARRSWTRAGRAGLGTWAGLVIGIAVRLALALAMLGVFIAAYLL